MTPGAITVSATGGAILGLSGNRIAAGTLTLTAGGAIGSSAQHLNTRVAGLSLTNTGGIHVDNSVQLLTSLTINNKHSASTANTLSVTSQGLVFNVTDDGSTTTLGEVSSPFLTSFGFTGDKALVLGQLDLEDATAAAVTTTAGSILDDGNSLTAISAKKITLTATGGIGAAGQAIGIDTTDFTVTTAGNLHIANRGHFSFLGITSRHADVDADHTFSVTGQNLDFALTDAKATGYTVSRVIHFDWRRRRTEPLHLLRRPRHHAGRNQHGPLRL